MGIKGIVERVGRDIVVSFNGSHIVFPSGSQHIFDGLELRPGIVLDFCRCDGTYRVALDGRHFDGLDSEDQI